MGVDKKAREVVLRSYDDLSKNQKIIYNYIVRDNLSTPKSILEQKKTDYKENISRQAILKTINKLCDFGLIKRLSKGVYIKGGYSSPTTSSDNKEDYRLHAKDFVISLIESSPRYERLLKVRNQDELDGNTLMLYKDNLVVYLNKDFESPIPRDTEKLCLDYVNRFIVMLENNYNIILKKGRQFNLKFFRGEIAKKNDSIAKTFRIEKKDLKIYDDDGKLRLIGDFSFKVDELEAVNNEFHISDMEKIDKHKKILKSIITNDNLLSPEELQKKVEVLLEVSSQLQNSLKEQIEFNKSGQELQRDNMLIMRALMKEVEELKRK